MDLLIFLEKKTSRTNYVFNHIFKHILGLNLSFTTEFDVFIQYDGPKIEYSQKKQSNTLFFHASDLLFEDNIYKQDLEVSTYKNIKVFFLSSDSDSCLPFDPFAATFYMLTRYEEYLDVTKDKFGRFPAHESLSYKHDFLNIPVVDYWIIFIKEKLKLEFPNLIFKKHSFQFYNTIDVDNAFAYLEKGVLRNWASFIKDILQFRWKNIQNKIKVLCLGYKDPYDNYDELLRINTKYNLSTLFFFLLSEYGRYDATISFSSRKLQNTIQHISTFCDIGVHASFQSIKYPKKITSEITKLSNFLSKKITFSRQHYIVLNIPKNYQNLIKNNIEHDYSMGYPSLPGFRAGTSYNYYFFDLSINQSTLLLIHPFCVMDVTFLDYMKLNADEALDVIKKNIDEVKKVNGNFISIWHNESLDYLGRWKGWDSVYEDMVKYALDEVS